MGECVTVWVYDIAALLAVDLAKMVYKRLSSGLMRGHSPAGSKNQSGNLIESEIAEEKYVRPTKMNFKQETED